MDDTDRDRGLYPKYNVSKILRVEGDAVIEAPVTDRVFVLNVDKDPMAKAVLAQYAVEARHRGFQQLADDIVYDLLGYPRKEE